MQLQRWFRSDAEVVLSKCKDAAVQGCCWSGGAEVVKRWCRGGGAKVSAKHQVVHVVQRRWCKGGVVMVQSAGAEVVQRWCRGGGVEGLQQGCGAG